MSHSSTGIRVLTCAACGATQAVPPRTTGRVPCDACGMPIEIPAGSGSSARVSLDAHHAAVFGEEHHGAPPPENDRMACPGCGAHYGFSQAIVGQRFQCAQCQCRFEVAVDRSTRPVATPRPATSRSSATPVAGPGPGPNNATTTASGPQEASVSGRQAVAGRRSKSQTVRLNAEQIQRVNQSLSQLAARAAGSDPDEGMPTAATPSGPALVTARSSRRLGTVTASHDAPASDNKTSSVRSGSSVRRPSAVATRSSSRLKPATRRLERKGGQVGDLGPAVTTGEGEEAGRTYRNHVLVGLVVALLVAIVASFYIVRDPRRTALTTFSGGGFDPSQRITAMQGRSPAGGRAITPIEHLIHARFGPVQHINLASVLAIFGGHLPIDPGRSWERLGSNPPDVHDHTALLARLAEQVPAEQLPLLDALLSATPVGPRVHIHEKRATPDGKSIELRDVHLYEPRPSSAGVPTLGELLARGRVPVRLEACTFSGDDGRLLHPVLEALPTAYSGWMVRFRGPGFDGQWRVAVLNAVTPAAASAPAAAPAGDVEAAPQPAAAE
jgi:hypothetical protein